MRRSTRDPAASCEACAYIAEHGWLGPRAPSHCQRCHRSWTAKNQAHCTGCCSHFSSTSAFDVHLRTHDLGETVEHLDPATVRNRKTGEPLLVLGEDDFGSFWRHPGERPVPSADESETR